MRLMVAAAVVAGLMLATPGVPGQVRAGPGEIVGLSRVGMCARTTVRSVGQRLMDGGTGRVIPNSGSTITLANGVIGISYDQIAGINGSRRADPVLTCLVSIPRRCPPGDLRGRHYTTTNLRTLESWTLPDSAHGCGGA